MNEMERNIKKIKEWQNGKSLPEDVDARINQKRLEDRMNGIEREKGYYDVNSSLYKQIQRELKNSPAYNGDVSFGSQNYSPKDNVVWDWSKKLCCENNNTDPSSRPSR